MKIKMNEYALMFNITQEKEEPEKIKCITTFGIEYDFHGFNVERNHANTMLKMDYETYEELSKINI